MRVGRPYQLEAIEAVRSAFRRGVKGCALELSTGTGKGFIIAAICRDVIAKGKRALVLVNRDNLCNQLHDSLVEQKLLPRIERAMDKASPMSNLVVGSIPTLQGERLKKWGQNHFDLVITDEAHFAAADTFKATLDHFRASYHVFFSATMERHDGEGLWDGVSELVYSYPLNKAIDDGWLVGFDVEELPVPITISDKQAGKKMWTQKDEDGVFSAGNYLPRLFAESAARCRDKHAILFWTNCDASKEADAHFRSLGIDSRHVDGYMKDSEIEAFYEWFKQPGPKVGHNADLLSYGYDNPLIDCVGIMRLQRSVPMLKQRLGRGTRPACVVDGFETAEQRRAAIAASFKPTCKVLDLMIQIGAVSHTFADSTALITADPEEREFLRQEKRKAGKQLTMEEIAGKLKAKRETDREKQLAKQAEDAANAARRAEDRKSLPYIGDILSRFNPSHKPATPQFRKFIERLGYNLGDGELSAYQLMRIKERHDRKQESLAV